MLIAIETIDNTHPLTTKHLKHDSHKEGINRINMDSKITTTITGSYPPRTEVNCLAVQQDPLYNLIYVMFMVGLCDQLARDFDNFLVVHGY